MTHREFDELDSAAVPVPRRWLLRTLAATTVGVVVLVGLSACGGEGGEEEDEEDDD